jgi:hypothetical protein
LQGEVPHVSALLHILRQDATAANSPPGTFRL